MKTTATSASRALRWRPRGVALIMVLVCMALLMVLVLAMLSLSRVETQSSATSGQITKVRNLAQMPANLVMGQIRQATSGLGHEKTWASQPGMIRVFGMLKDSRGRGRLESAWKLYSSAAMVEDGTFSPATETGAMTGWREKPASFTDLNEPVALPQSGGTVRCVYPILDPSAVGKVDGLSVDAAAPGVTEEQPVPMPVRWLYVLQDGQFAVPVSEVDGVAKFADGKVTKENPVVARIAFWTDDESCKVNLNTAGEGTPWDVPRTTGWTDRNYGAFIPAQNEFQRFPGHPAMTSLSPVLGAFDDRYKWRDPGINSSGTVTSTAFTDYLRDIYALLPRTNHGGGGESSWGGARLVTSLTGTPVKQERLYASVDEFFFDSARQRNGTDSTYGTAPLDADELNTARFFLTAHSRAPETNLWNRPRVSLWPQNADKASPATPKDRLLAFCSTSAGREIAWKRSRNWKGPTDWGSSQSPDEDFNLGSNRLVFRYLQTLTRLGVPAFGSATFHDKYGQDNRNQILLQMFDLQRWGVNSTCSLFDPATNSLDNGKSYFYLPPRAYSGLNPNWLAELSAVPTVVTSLPNGDSPPSSTGALKAFGRFHTVVEAAVVFMATAVEGKDSKGNPAPVTATSGGTPTDEVNNITGAAGADGYADKTLKMRAYLVLQPFCPTVGMPPFTAHIRYRIKGLESWTINGTPLFPAGISNACNRATSPAGANNENAHATGYTGLHGQFLWRDGWATRTKQVPGFDEDRNYIFCSDEVDVTSSPQVQIPSASPVTLTIELHSGFGPAPTAAQTPLQKVQMTFPVTTIRVPKLKTDQMAFMDFNKRLESTGSLRDRLINYGDTVRSVVVDAQGPSKGDYRLIAALPVVTPDHFRPHPNYAKITKIDSKLTTDTNNPDNDQSYWDEAQSLRYASNNYQGHYGRVHNQTGVYVNAGQQHTWQTCGYRFSTDGKSITKAYGLVKNVPYWQDCVPAQPILLDGALNADGRPGDWDNGTARIEDGPYINKPDEGGQDGGGGGYFGRGGFTEERGRNYSPNRQICSAVAFGSLPTGIYSSPPRPWQTLLFCPNPPSRTTVAEGTPTELDHFGFKAPHDHLLLDLFWMPIVEPYAISEPASTAGKVSMNWQMMPFTHIRRSTALHAAMRSVRLSAMPSAMAWAADALPAGASTAQKQECYKAFLDADNLKFDTNYTVNMAETLKGFETRFAQGDVFRSASEICSLFLVPKPIPGHSYMTKNLRTGAALPKPGMSPALKDMVSWWNGNPNNPDDGLKLTGDNARESPYNQLYPRLTTRSNVFLVHYRVQLLQKARSTAADVWDESKDRFVAEQRGSTLIERYLDPNDSAVPDFVADPSAKGALDDHYRFRTIRSKIFAP